MDPARRRRRRRLRRAWMMSGFSLLTFAVLVFVAATVMRLDKTGPHALVPAALSTRAAKVQGDAVMTKPAVTDKTTGLSYVRLGAPWQAGCPAVLSTAEFRWTSGESAVAGLIPSGNAWHGLACSGPLPRQFAGQAPVQAAWSVADSAESLYYNGLSHSLSIKRSAAVRVDGKPGWLAEFLVRYHGGQHL
ncbi:MAG TPA: hypothetical protein VGG16_23845, partial [Streptosporangiaceae bacterium]